MAIDQELSYKIAKFVGFAVIDILTPDFISKPIGLATNFYTTFLYTNPDDRNDLFAELGNGSPQARQAVTLQMHEQVRTLMPPGQQNHPELQALCERFVACLEAARQAAASRHDPAEELRKVLNRHFFPNGEAIAPRTLSPAEAQVGRLRVSAILRTGLDSAPRPLPSFDPTKLPLLRDYEFLGVIGVGGFATVYKATHLPTGELRAVKIGDVVEPERFHRELRVVERLNSPHLINYHEHDTFPQDGLERYWIAMEYLGEQTLADVMAQPDFRQRPDDVLLIAEQILTGLNDLHNAGIIHRDVKPANIMFDRHNRVKLIDYGLAKPVDHADMHTTASVGASMGTPYYMSPEQLHSSKDLTPASDLYSCGLTIYEMLTGTNPNERPGLAAVILEAHKTDRDWDHPNIPAEVQALLRRCLTVEPGQRPQVTSDYLIDWHRQTEPVVERVIYERDRNSWLAILDMNLLPTYLENCVAQGCQPDPREFNRRLAEEGIVPLDGPRLGELLPTLQQAQNRIQQSIKELATAKQTMAQQTANWDSVQIKQQGLHIEQLEANVEAHVRGRTEVIQQQLSTEIQDWEDIREKRTREKLERNESRQAAAVAEAKRRKELDLQSRRQFATIAGGIVGTILGALAGAIIGFVFIPVLLIALIVLVVILAFVLASANK